MTTKSTRYNLVITNNNYVLLGLNKLNRKWYFPGNIIVPETNLVDTIKFQINVALTAEHLRNCFNYQHTLYYIVPLTHMAPTNSTYFATTRWISFEDLPYYPLSDDILSFYTLSAHPFKENQYITRIVPVILTSNRTDNYLLTVNNKYDLPFEVKSKRDDPINIKHLIENYFNFTLPATFIPFNIVNVDTIYYIFRVSHNLVTPNASLIKLDTHAHTSNEYQQLFKLITINVFRKNLYSKLPLLISLNNHFPNTINVPNITTPDFSPPSFAPPTSALYFGPKIVSAGTIILDPSEEKVLLILDNRSKMWGFPKGHVELGENEKQAAVRETFEETGIILSECQLTQRFTVKHVSLYKVILPLTVKLSPQDKNEISDIKWIPIADLKDYNVTGVVTRFFLQGIQK